jgi:hypothetical protein
VTDSSIPPFTRFTPQFSSKLFRQRFLRDVSQLGRVNLDHISSDPEGATEAIATADLIHQARMNVLAGSWQSGRIVRSLDHRDCAVELSHLACDAGEDSPGCVVHKASLSKWQSLANYFLASATDFQTNFIALGLAHIFRADLPAVRTIELARLDPVFCPAQDSAGVSLRVRKGQNLSFAQGLMQRFARNPPAS